MPAQERECRLRAGHSDAVLRLRRSHRWPLLDLVEGWRRVTGARGSAIAALTALAGGGFVWSRHRRTAAESAVATASEVTLTAVTGGELARAAYEFLPAQQRNALMRREVATAVAAVSAMSALRRALAEPRDL